MFRRWFLVVLFCGVGFLAWGYRPWSGWDCTSHGQKVSEIQRRINGLFNPMIVIDHFLWYSDGRLPGSLPEVMQCWREDDEDGGQARDIMEVHCADPFSREERWMEYLPIYDSADRVMSFVLLSAGVDGVFDNDNSRKLRWDDWRESLALYNPDEFDSYIPEPAGRRLARIGQLYKIPSFYAPESRLGGKDLLVYVYHLLQRQE